jgi:hypothetical protein
MADDITLADTGIEEHTEEGEILQNEDVQSALDLQLSKGKNEKYLRLTLAALSSIPWVGTFISVAAGIGSATAGLKGDSDQDKVNELVRLWLEEHQEKIKLLGTTLQDVYARLDNFGDEIKERINSQEYLSLVRSAFRSWDEAETEEKRKMIKMLITNAGAIKLCSDDVIRLFIKWINEYHELHFAVIKEVYTHPGTTRGQIWDSIYGQRPADNSAEADLFKYLMHELQLGEVIRNERRVTGRGEYLRDIKPKGIRYSNNGSQTMQSPFDDTKPQELTELGKQFISYVLNDVVTRIGS